MALPESLGVPVGTVTLEDFERRRDLLLRSEHRHQQPAHAAHLQDGAAARRPHRDVQPAARARAWRASPTHRIRVEMLTRHGHADQRPSTIRSRRAATWLPSWASARRDRLGGREAERGGVLDWDFIHEHTIGFDGVRDEARAAVWAAMERRSGLTRSAMEAAALSLFARRRGHRHLRHGNHAARKGVKTVQMLANLLLLRGNIGKPGAGICPVRGHSNVQGQRTVGITEKPELVPLDRAG